MLEFIFRWEVVAATVGVLLTVAFGVLALDDFRIAKACFAMAAADLAGGIAMWGVNTPLGWKARVPIAAMCFAVLGVMLVESWRYIDSKRQAKQHPKNEVGDRDTSSAKPFSVAVESSLQSNRTDVGTPFWATFSGIKGLSRAPLSVLAVFRIVNLQESGAVISQFTIEAASNNGWIKLARLPGSTIRIYWIPQPQNDFSSAIEVRPEMLDQVLSGRAISPKETVKGWVAMCYPRTLPPAQVANKYRITIADTAGHKQTIESEPLKSGDFPGNQLAVLPGKQDISKYPVQLIQDLPGYWTN